MIAEGGEGCGGYLLSVSNARGVARIFCFDYPWHLFAPTCIHIHIGGIQVLWCIVATSKPHHYRTKKETSELLLISQAE